MENIALFNKEDLKVAVFEALNEYESKKESDKLYTVNSIAKRLGKSHKTISKLVSNGFIKTTKSGLIPENEIENYLKNRI